MVVTDSIALGSLYNSPVCRAFFARGYKPPLRRHLFFKACDYAVYTVHRRVQFP